MIDIFPITVIVRPQTFVSIKSLSANYFSQSHIFFQSLSENDLVNMSSKYEFIDVLIFVEFSVRVKCFCSSLLSVLQIIPAFNAPRNS